MWRGNNNKMASSKQTTDYTTTTTATPGGGTHKRWHYAEEEKPQVTQETLDMMNDLADSFMTWAMDKYMTEEEKVECTQANKSMSEIWDMLKPRHLIAEEEYCEEGIMHCCMNCDYELTDAQFCEGKGRVMFCADNGIGEGEYRCGVCDPRCSDPDGLFPDED